MLDIKNIEFQTIPNFSRYGISKKGVVIELKTNMIMAPTRHNRSYLCVELLSDGRNNRFIKPSVARLVLTTYKPLPLGILQEYTSVNYLNGNWYDVELDNLEWEYGTYVPLFVPGINLTHYKFVKIPGFGSYEINGLCQVQHHGKLIEPFIANSGYHFVFIKNSEKKGHFGIHFLMALTFLEHPLDTSQLVVNHKNGITSDNSVSNLEWATYTENILHAYATNLRTQNKPILTMEITTRQITRHYSLGSFCRNLKIDQNTLWNRLKYNRPITPYMGYYIKYEEDERLWPAEGFVFGRRPGVANEVKMLNLVTKEELLFPSAAKAAIYLKKDQASLQYQLNKSTLDPYYGYFVKFADNIQPWPKIPEIIPDRPLNQSIPVAIKSVETSKIRVFDSIHRAGVFLKISDSQIRSRLTSEKPVPIHGYHIRYANDKISGPKSEDDVGISKTTLRPISIKNIETGIILKFSTAAETSRYIGNCFSGQITAYANFLDIRPLLGYYIRNTSDNIKWPDANYVYRPPKPIRPTCSVIITHKETGEVLKFASIKEAISKTNIKRSYFFPVKSGDDKLSIHDVYYIKKSRPVVCRDIRAT